MQFLHHMQTTASKVSNAGVFDQGYVAARKMSQGLMLKENGEVPSALLYCCYRNFCEEHKLERVPELRHGIDPANIRQFLHKFNMSFEQTTAVDIGRIRGITMQQQQTHDGALSLS